MEDLRNKLNNEITTLYNKAREYEKWMIDHTESPNFFEVKNCYDNVLFRLNQKKEQLDNIGVVLQIPQTVSLPPKDTRHYHMH